MNSQFAVQQLDGLFLTFGRQKVKLRAYDEVVGTEFKTFTSQTHFMHRMFHPEEGDSSPGGLAPPSGFNGVRPATSHGPGGGVPNGAVGGIPNGAVGGARGAEAWAVPPE